MATQFGAVSGRRFRNPYLDEINAKLPYLGQQRAAEQRMRDEKYRRSVIKDQQKLAEEKAKQDKKNADMANIMGGIKTVANIGTGLYNSGALNGIFGGDVKDNAIKEDTLNESPTTEQPDMNLADTTQSQNMPTIDINRYIYEDQGSSGNDFGSDMWDFSSSLDFGGM